MAAATPRRILALLIMGTCSTRTISRKKPSMPGKKRKIDCCLPFPRDPSKGRIASHYLPIYSLLKPGTFIIPGTELIASECRGDLR